jgi:hypothetical protein
MLLMVQYKSLRAVFYCLHYLSDGHPTDGPVQKSMRCLFLPPRINNLSDGHPTDGPVQESTRCHFFAIGGMHKGYLSFFVQQLLRTTTSH